MQKAGVVLVLIALVVGVFVAAQLHREPTAQAQVAGVGGFKPLTLAVEGNFRVNCSCAYNDKDKTSQDLKEELVKKIEFHPEYIVLHTQYGGGRIIPVYAIKTFTWEPV